MKSVSFSSIDKKWQDEWGKAKVFEAKEDTKKDKYYALEMYAYPSGKGLHMGHAFQFIIGDVLARYMRMKGKSVLYPTGYDSFGLPAENAAIKEGVHPQKYTDTSIKRFIEQQKALGLSYDWDRILWSHDSKYYKWNQYFFLQFLKKGLAYRKESPVNWCSKCESVLANEQVHNGKCWRHGDTSVIVKNLEQWFVKTTKYAEELLRDVDKLDWPERIKIMQRNWIGKSEGAEIDFTVSCEKWPVFTTRADTLFGVTFLVVSAQHSKLDLLVTVEQKKDVSAFLKKIKSVKQEDVDKLEKEGVFTGSYAIHPLTGENIPIWVGNFVVADYGSGMVMGVPAHDTRDFAFAKKYGLEIKQVIKPVFGEPNDKAEFRKTISAVIHRKKDNKFLMVKWKKFGWISPVVGGIDDGESAEQAAEREVFEETGYKVKAVKKLGGEIESYFFADNKNVWRHRLDQPILLELINDKPVKVSVDESDKLETIWLSSDEVFTKTTHSYNLAGFSKFLGKEEAYTGNGKLIHSGAFDGLDNNEAKEHIVIALNEKKLGRKVTQYKLRDWLISRQRYWGTPIPIIYCDSCGTVPVPEKELPVLLPGKVTFGKGNPLATNKSFVNAKCPSCGKAGRRETDTMDTFFDSSWYYLRFTDSGNEKQPLSPDCVSYWMPVDFYTGGAEHACMHLIYARFFTKALRDLGYLRFDEPFKRLFNQGMVHGSDGFVMSKSRGNGVDPLDITKKYGADTLRLFLVSMASPDKDSIWSDAGIEGMYKFTQRLWDYSHSVKFGKSSARVQHKLNKAIIDVAREIESLHYNIAIIKLRALFDCFDGEIYKEDFASFVKLLAPFAPHIAEELSSKFTKAKKFVSISSWPVVDESKIDENVDKTEKIVEQTVTDVQNVLRIVREKSAKELKHVYLYAIPSEVGLFDVSMLRERLGLDVSVFAVNDKKKFDPEGKSAKAKPGKPGIYVS